MPKVNYKVDNSSVNKNKLIYWPLLIGVVAILTVSLASYVISRELLLNQMKQDGINMAKITAKKITSGMYANDVINNLIEDKIKLTGKAVISNRENISNELLINIADEFNIDEINWYSPDGKVIFTNIERHLGWIPPENHPVMMFILSNENDLIEEIRKCTETDQFYKYGYFRSVDGSLIQVGVIASKIHELTESFTLQEIVESLADEENILYALVLDTDLMAVADSDLEDIGVIYEDDEDYLKALNGETVASQWFYDQIQNNVIEIAAPIINGNEIVGIIGIGLSMDIVYSSIYFILLSFTIITIIMVMLFLWVQRKNVIYPINKLDQDIRQIEVEKDLGHLLPLPDKDTFIGLFSTINNLIEKINRYFHQLREKEAYIAHIAYHDSLTDLPNRRLFTKKLKSELHHKRPGAVMILDIDNFKSINDTLGHIYGDKVLKSVADGLRDLKEENIFISKFGGDEFLILLTNEQDSDEIENFVKKIMTFFKNKIRVEEDEVYITCSIGVTLYPFNSNNVDQLIMNADMALYSVKATGKNDYMFFSDEMLERVNNKIQLENVIREALKVNGFKLLYQPQVCTFTGKVVGFEALLRIKDYNISPALFIPVAEETRMIIEIGRWTTSEVINQLAEWKNNGYVLKPIAINFSAKQLNDDGYISFLQNELNEKGIDARYIEIEITESLFMDRKEKTIEFLKQLKTLGVKIALDDFGTGYSSLSYLTFLPVDKLKLDKSLSDRYLESNNAKVIEGVISLAHSLNLEVVAEGIEDIEQYIQLNNSKCNYIQGYLFSRPLEIDLVEEIYYQNFLESIELEEISE